MINFNLATDSKTLCCLYLYILIDMKMNFSLVKDIALDKIELLKTLQCNGPGIDSLLVHVHHSR